MASDFETLDDIDGEGNTKVSVGVMGDHPTIALLERAIKEIRGKRWNTALACISDAAGTICAEQTTYP